MADFLSSVLNALGGDNRRSSKAWTESGPGPGDIVEFPENLPPNSPYFKGKDQSGGFLGELTSILADIIKGKRDKRLINTVVDNAARHASWLRDVANNPPRPEWVNAPNLRGPGPLTGHTTSPVWESDKQKI